MPTHDEALLEAAEHQLERPEGQRGRLSRARVRRCVSTVYYAIFHFLLDEIGQKLADRVKNSIAAWRAATSDADRDFKHAICVLMLLKGQLRLEP